MTSAIKATIEEFAAPPRSKDTPFSQTRITQMIRSNQLKSPDAPSLPWDGPHDDNVRSDVEGSVSSTATLNPESPPPRSRPTAPALQDPEKITASTINSHTYSAGLPPLDLFIRTSGVMRLSDFMLWQCHQDTHIFFLQCFWPEFDLWHFIPVLLEWQWRRRHR